MSHVGFYLVAFVHSLTLTYAQAPAAPSDVYRVGNGVGPPRLLHKVEPEYSPLARADHVQGMLVLQLVVDDKGRPTNITVLSPLGFGLDEQAQAAVEKWEFTPGMKDGKPVKVLATVEVHFRFPDFWFDDKAERRRTSFNLALQTLSRPGVTGPALEHAVRTMQDLSQQKFPAAMHQFGMWQTTGDHVAKDPENGLALIEKAAAKHYGPALYEVSIRQIEGHDLPKNVEKGMEEMRRAATLGSPHAQFYLGNRYEKGDGVPREIDRARRYFRLCAVQGIAACQYRLANLLYGVPDRPERDYMQAVALFQLASEQGLEEAKGIASRESANLSPTQNKWVSTLKAQLVRR